MGQGRRVGRKSGSAKMRGKLDLPALGINVPIIHPASLSVCFCFWARAPELAEHTVRAGALVHDAEVVLAGEDEFSGVISDVGCDADEEVRVVENAVGGRAGGRIEEVAWSMRVSFGWQWGSEKGFTFHSC